ncbi:MAG: peptide chain release factor N(5)-glutamine methyltransferase [Pedobacter sp.]|nr:MAG: peptide chain release factor N(5)-glutamine methyltransferase [Pedobacter sp.]
MTFRDQNIAFKELLAGIYDDDEIFTLFLSVHDLTRAGYIIHQNDTIDPSQLADSNAALQDLRTGKPLQYILGTAPFYGLDLLVNEHVLIPRPETEELVEWVLDCFVPRNDGETVRPIRILDIGTGSGCIPVALKVNLPGASVSAIDISAEAIGVAQKNSELNKAPVHFIEADILNWSTSDKFDVIISNPPYITMKEQADMHINVLNNEPHLALFVPDNDPLKFYSAIADLSLTALNKGGSLFFEINAAYGNDVVAMLKEKGFKDIILKKDMQGKERMLRSVFSLES